jgi:hypothetical protein
MSAPVLDEEFAACVARLALARIASGDPDPRRLATIALADIRALSPDYVALSREHLARYPKIRAHLADSPARNDPRDPDHSKQGIFVYHNCHRCADGARLDRCPTPERPGNCGYPHARND